MAKGNSYRDIVKRTRARLYEEQHGRCYYCQRKMLLVVCGRADGRTHPLQVTLDHIIPRGMGGTRAPTLNAVAACSQCNSERGDRDAREFILEKMGALS